MLEFIRKKQELVYDAKIVSLYKDYLETPNGDIVEYDFIHHKSGGGAGVLLVDEREHTYLVRQYRNSIDSVDLEIPAGGYAYIGEDGSVCALREAEEETGLVPDRLHHVGNIVSSIGTFDERTDVYIGTGLTPGKKHLDPDEYIDVVCIPVDEAIRMVFQGQIVDSKTVLALFAYREMKNSGIIQKEKS